MIVKVVFLFFFAYNLCKDRSVFMCKKKVRFLIVLVFVIFLSGCTKFNSDMTIKKDKKICKKEKKIFQSNKFVKVLFTFCCNNSG